MKPRTALLAASLLANVALIAAFMAVDHRGPAAAESTADATPLARESKAGANDTALRRALESGDARALEAAGVPASVARELAMGRAFSRVAEKVRAARAGQADSRWWRQRDGNAVSREELLQLRRELSDAMIAAFGEDLSSMATYNSLAFLPADKREALRRITQDYDEMMAKFTASGIQLPSDREKLRLLRAERDRDIAALLTSEERLAYEMRTSPTAAAVRARYGEGLETEDDFRKIYALQKAFDDKFPLDTSGGRITPETMQQRLEAQRQLQDDIRLALGDEKFAGLRRATDSDLRNVDSLVTRLNLPPATTDQVAAAREMFAAESQRITADTSLNPQQRRAQIQELGTKAKSDLSQTLGAEAGEAYAQRSPWVSMLQGGVAFSTKPPTQGATAALPVGQSVYPVMPTPTGASGPVTTRQVVVSGGATTDVNSPVDLFFAPAGGTPIVRDNVQVMTFSTSGGSTPAGQPPAVIVHPPATPPPKQ